MSIILWMGLYVRPYNLDHTVDGVCIRPLNLDHTVDGVVYRTTQSRSYCGGGCV